MPRTRDMWTGVFVVEDTAANRKELLFRVQLDQDPQRIVMIRVPRRQIAAFGRYALKGIRELENHNGGRR